MKSRLPSLHLSYPVVCPCNVNACISAQIIHSSSHASVMAACSLTMHPKHAISRDRRTRTWSNDSDSYQCSISCASFEDMHASFFLFPSHRARAYEQ